MNRLFEAHVEYQVTTLSPLHAGSGFSADPSTCAVLPASDGASELHFFDPARVVALATDTERERLSSKLTSPDAGVLFEAMREFFSRSTERVRTVSQAAVEAPVALAEEFSKNAWRLKLEVQLCARNSAGFYLPGSGVKGAIRTAWIARLLQSRGKADLSAFAPQAAAALTAYNNKVLADQPANERSLKQELERASRRSIAAAFTAQGGDKLADLSLDPLRLLKVRDSAALAITPAAGGIRYVLDLKPLKDEVLIKGLAIRRLECIHEYQVDCTTLVLDIIDAAPLDRARRSTRDELPEAEGRPTLAAVTAACNSHYLPLLWHDIAWAQRLPGAGEWAKGIENWLRNGGQAAIEAGQVLLLRIGRHSGADALTLPRARAVKILRGEDPVSGRRRDPAYDTRGPRLVRAATLKHKEGVGVAPFGWVLLSPGPLRTALREPLAELYERRFGAWKQRAAHRAARLAEAELRRQQAEAAALAQQQQAEARARMTPNRQAIELLRDAFAANMSPQGKPIQRSLGDALTRKVFDLLGSALAGAWLPEERSELAELLAADAHRHIRLDSKERELKRGLRQLRGETA